MKRMLFTVFVSLLAVCLFFCSRDQTESESPAYSINAVTPDSDGKTKILLYYDMEGISGVNKTEQVMFGNPEYETGREYLTRDVNAVIEGLFAGGADAVHVTDAHGSGNPNPDVILDKLDSRARMIFRDTPFMPYVDLPETEEYDAVAVVCMHAKTGSNGFMAHTGNFGCDWIINGKSITETEIIAFSCGRFGIPVIFASGDDVLKEQLEYMGWMEYVTVKKSINFLDAELIPLEAVHAEMREKAEAAVENLESAKYMVFNEPLTAGLRTQFPADLGILEGVPGIDYKDHAVAFHARTFREAFDGIVELIHVARSGRQELMQEYLAQTEFGPEVSKGFREYMFNKFEEWIAGSWDPRAEPEKQDKKLQKYFGAR